MRSNWYPAVLAAALAVPAFAKLPALNDEAKAKATEAAAKSAWTEKVGLYKLCQRMDQVAAGYHRKSASAPAPQEAPACADPGPFVSPLAAASAPAAGTATTPLTPAKDKPLEASEAHSPAGMAVSPPSSKPTAAQLGTGATKPSAAATGTATSTGAPTGTGTGTSKAKQ